MRKYFLHNGTEQQGSFSIDDLKARNIKKETPVWCEGMTDWTPAGNVEELKNIFEQSTPPPFGKQSSSPPPPPPKSETKLSPQPVSPIKKKSSSKTVLLTVLGIVIGATFAIAALLFIANRHNGDTSTSLDTYQEKLMTVEEMERADPAKFLDASGTYRENFWGDAFKVDGTILNNATVANYKDVVVEVVFYSGTDTELDRKRYTIYDFFPAHSKKAFRLKLDIPRACRKLGWNAVSATPY